MVELDMMKSVKYNVGDEVPISEIGVASWESEMILTKSILKHIDEFMETTFGEKVTLSTGGKAETKKLIKLKTGQLFPVRGVRLDIWVECESGKKYILEVKNPTRSNYSSFKAIGQILGYSMKFPEATNLVIVSTGYDDGFLELVEKYNLPIDFVLITDTQTFLLKK